MTGKFRGFLSGVKAELPQLGTAGSRSARLHAEDTGAAEPDSRFDFVPAKEDGLKPVSYTHLTLPTKRIV